MSTLLVYLLYFGGIVISWIIFYYVVKAAVKNGVKEANSGKAPPRYVNETKTEVKSTSDQQKLQQQYDNGEIPFQHYQSEWNRLKNNG